MKRMLRVAAVACAALAALPALSRARASRPASPVVEWHRFLLDLGRDVAGFVLEHALRR